MKRFILGAKSCLLLFIYIVNLVFCGGINAKASSFDAVECYTGANIINNEARACAVQNDEVVVGSRLWELFFGKEKEKNSEVMLYPGGGVFGLHIVENGVTVTDVTESRVFRIGDRIVGIDGVSINGVTDVENAVKGCSGKRLSFDVIRGGERISINAIPTPVDGEYKLGIKLRAETAGIGTVTYVNPETLEFGGLGHGVTSSETGAPVSIKQAYAKQVMLGGC